MKGDHLMVGKEAMQIKCHSIRIPGIAAKAEQERLWIGQAAEPHADELVAFRRCQREPLG